VKGQIEFPSPLDTGFKDEYVHSSPQGIHYLGREPDMILWKKFTGGCQALGIKWEHSEQTRPYSHGADLQGP